MIANLKMDAVARDGRARARYVGGGGHDNAGWQNARAWAGRLRAQVTGCA